MKKICRVAGFQTASSEYALIIPDAPPPTLALLNAVERLLVVSSAQVPRGIEPESEERDVPVGGGDEIGGGAVGTGDGAVGAGCVGAPASGDVDVGVDEGSAIRLLETMSSSYQVYAVG